MSQPDNGTTVMRQLAPYLGLGAQLAASVLVPGAIGWWIDSMADSAPIGLIIGLVLGCVGGFVQFLRNVQQLLRRNKDDSPAS